MKNIRKQGSKVETYYTYNDKDLGKLKVKVTERFDDEGKQKGISEMRITQEIWGQKGVKIHEEIWKEHSKNDKKI